MPRLTRLPRTLAAVPLALALSAALPSGASAQSFPETVPLPAESQPEGIAGGPGTTFFAGARLDGAIYRGDLRTGEGSVLVPGQDGRVAVGMLYDAATGLLWVAGGATGAVTAYDGDTGEQRFRVTVPGDRFLNDVAVTRDAVYVTDSRNAELVVVPLGAGGALPAPQAVTLLALGGDYEQEPGFSANGIRVLPGGDLLVVTSGTGTLYRVDPATGEAAELPQTGGRELTSGDGLVLRGSTLYVVNGFGASVDGRKEDSVAVLRLDRGARSYEVVGRITDPDLDRPTTGTLAAGRLWVVNGRFSVAAQEGTEFSVVRLPS